MSWLFLCLYFILLPFPFLTPGIRLLLSSLSDFYTVKLDPFCHYLPGIPETADAFFLSFLSRNINKCSFPISLRIYFCLEPRLQLHWVKVISTIWSPSTLKIYPTWLDHRKLLFCNPEQQGWYSQVFGSSWLFDLSWFLQYLEDKQADCTQWDTSLSPSWSELLCVQSQHWNSNRNTKWKMKSSAWSSYSKTFLLLDSQGWSLWLPHCWGRDWTGCVCLSGSSLCPAWTEQNPSVQNCLRRGTAWPSHSPEQNWQRCLLRSHYKPH